MYHMQNRHSRSIQLDTRRRSWAAESLLDRLNVSIIIVIPRLWWCCSGLNAIWSLSPSYLSPTVHQDGLQFPRTISWNLFEIWSSALYPWVSDSICLNPQNLSAVSKSCRQTTYRRQSARWDCGDEVIEETSYPCTSYQASRWGRPQCICRNGPNSRNYFARSMGSDRLAWDIPIGVSTTSIRTCHEDYDFSYCRITS